MTDIEITEVGPREGFQFERQQIAPAAKASLISALTRTGVTEIQAVSFVSRRTMPHVADADEVLRLVDNANDTALTALWFSPSGFARARNATGLALKGLATVSASPPFTERNWNTDEAGMRDLNLRLCEQYVDAGIDVRINLAAAFGCNFGGAVAPATVLRLLTQTMEDIRGFGLTITEVALADTMAWANPHTIRSLCSLVRPELGDIPLRLHLHDTRGVGLANALAAVEAGVRHFDAAIAGLGGCPFAGHQGAAGNIATEDFYYLCQSLGLTTGLIPDRLIEAGELAEQVVGHASSSRTLKGGFAPLAALSTVNSEE